MRQPSMMSPTRKIGLGIVVLQEVEHQLRLAAARSQVNVGKEDRAVAGDGFEGLRSRRRLSAESKTRHVPVSCPDSHVAAMTAGAGRLGRDRRALETVSASASRNEGQAMDLGSPAALRSFAPRARAWPRLRDGARARGLPGRRQRRATRRSAEGTAAEIRAATGAEVIEVAGDVGKPRSARSAFRGLPEARHSRQQQRRAAAARLRATDARTDPARASRRTC